MAYDAGVGRYERSQRMRPEQVMSREERDKLIVYYRNRGATMKQIAQALGMTVPGVQSALNRLAAGDDGYWEGWTE